ncbi:MAG TPA: hypothetical protein VLL52_00715 [Anaerolineae bacterium]|nr:hypothetical protein [Anaerolineae bacterium]
MDSKDIRGIIVFIVVILAVVFMRLRPNDVATERLLDAQDTSSWETLEHDEFGYAISYPKSWLIIVSGINGEKGNPYVRSRISGLTLNIFVHQHAISNPTIDDIVVWNNEEIRATNEIDRNELVPTTIGKNNYIAYKIEYQEIKSQLHIDTEIYYLIQDDQMYAINIQNVYESGDYDKRVIINNFLNSFEVIK